MPACVSVPSMPRLLVVLLLLLLSPEAIAYVSQQQLSVMNDLFTEMGGSRWSKPVFLGNSPCTWTGVTCDASGNNILYELVYLCYWLRCALALLDCSPVSVIRPLLCRCCRQYDVTPCPQPIYYVCVCFQCMSFAQMTAPIIPNVLGFPCKGLCMCSIFASLLSMVAYDSSLSYYLLAEQLIAIEARGSHVACVDTFCFLLRFVSLLVCTSDWLRLVACFPLAGCPAAILSGAFSLYHRRGLDFRNNNLVGTIPESVWTDLPYLQYVHPTFALKHLSLSPRPIPVMLLLLSSFAPRVLSFAPSLPPFPLVLLLLYLPPSFAGRWSCRATMWSAPSPAPSPLLPHSSHWTSEETRSPAVYPTSQH